MVEKRTIKISVAVMAIAALVMGLAIGLGQKNKNDKTSSASSLQSYQRVCDQSTAGIASGGAKSGKSGGRRELIVPGTEDAAVSLGSGKRRMMKEELLRGKLCFVLLSIYLTRPPWKYYKYYGRVSLCSDHFIGGHSGSCMA